MTQIAVFREPNIKSKETSNIPTCRARGGIYCDLLSFPTGPSSNAIMKNGQWEEVAVMGNGAYEGSPFVIELDDEDDATNQLVGQLRKDKRIEEIAIYEPATDNRYYGYFFSKIFVNQVTDEIIDDTRSVKIHCRCISFRRKDYDNNEYLWNWETRDDTYSGTLR